MGTRNIIAISGAQGKGVSNAERIRREYEESLISSTGTDLDDLSDVVFMNAAAKKEYARALRRLREEHCIIGNLNKSDLVSYANSYGRYMALIKESRKRGFRYLDDSGKANPLVRMIDETRRDMAESSRRLGMTLDGQLKTAKARADREEAEMEDKFGVI